MPSKHEKNEHNTKILLTRSLTSFESAWGKFFLRYTYSLFHDLHHAHEQQHKIHIWKLLTRMKMVDELEWHEIKMHSRLLLFYQQQQHGKSVF